MMRLHTVRIWFGYNRAMAIFRVVLMVIAVIHLLLAAFTAVVGQFADGGDIGSRLVLSALHPLAAIGIVLLVFLQRLPKPVVAAVAALMILNIAADVTLAVLIASGVVKGDWWLPLVFAVVPTIALTYVALDPRSETKKPETTAPSA